jgi:gliding motility-associated-like protein
MTIEIVGNMPDAPFEILQATISHPEIMVNGNGSDMIQLTNAGAAKSTDFKEVLLSIVYQNLADSPTGGLRTIEVQFETESGSLSNVATAFVIVEELPAVDVEIGDDIEVCEGETITLDAGVPNSIYDWSTGAHTQTITVSQSGQYSVTVSNGVNCPGRDTVNVEIVPVVTVSLTGDTEICDNETANLLIQTNTPFPFSVDISSDPGSPFSFPDVSGDFAFTDLPAQTTTYTITNVTPSQGACIEITDPEQIIEVYPTYTTSLDTAICSGDSIWLGYYWETEAGQYDVYLETQHGCDSTVFVDLDILPAVEIAMQSTTCDSAAAGVFVTYLNNPNGCDTVVTTTVSLLPSDTTAINLQSCILANSGVSIDTFTNVAGCDSLIITTTGYLPPADTTFLYDYTCDTAMVGVLQYALTGADGCDSLVITTTYLDNADTTLIFGTSCDTSIVGVSEYALTGADGCDSLIISTISLGTPDTTLLFDTSCDTSNVGVFQYALTGQDDCDSLVITTVTYAAQDSTFITSSTCDSANVGIVYHDLSGHDGCDSIVTETITLLPSDEVIITGTTCDPADAGEFLHMLTNQYGCDSIVHETISLLPSDQTFLTDITCKSSEAGVFISALINQHGCDSIVTLTVSLIPADTTSIQLMTCDPVEVGVVENTFTNQDGCDSLVITSTDLFPLPSLDVVVTSDFNGYGISCFGESDGSATASVMGIGPFTYTWSTGHTDQSITGLSAGAYDVTITDANGCETSGTVILDAPEEFSITFEITEPDCFGNGEGSIAIIQSGGIAPVQYSINGIDFQMVPQFDGLAEGTYTITALDANDCEVKEIIWINVPLPVNVELGDDRVILPGDTTIIDAVVNIPFDSLASVVWNGLNNPDCPNCLTQPVAPIITTTYYVSIASHDGCSDQDSMTIFVERDIDVYVPNIFSPNGDGINDRLIISGGEDVAVIESLMIYDRWGDLVFSAKNILPGDPDAGWDGRSKGQSVNPGVFAYRMMVRFKDGRMENRYGDVTIIR